MKIGNLLLLKLFFQSLVITILKQNLLFMKLIKKYASFKDEQDIYNENQFHPIFTSVKEMTENMILIIKFLIPSCNK